jgi:hypothetical protein
MLMEFLFFTNRRATAAANPIRNLFVEAKAFLIEAMALFRPDFAQFS